MGSPRISVVLPVYNAQSHLRQAVQSILDQTFADFELIAVDDGSTDASLSILRRFAAFDDRVKIISRPNTGLIGALHDGSAAMKSDLLARMDADDVCLPTRFEKQLAYMDAHPGCVLLGAFVRAIDPHGLTLWEESPPVGHETLSAELMKGRGGVIRHPAAMIRREALLRVGNYRKEFKHAEDVDLFLRLSEAGEVANIPEILLEYRQHYQSINRTQYATQTERVTQAVREAAARRGCSLPEGWRYEPTPPRPAEQQLRDWGWLALKRQRADIARKHAWSLLGMSPLKLDSWRLMACALRGR